MNRHLLVIGFFVCAILSIYYSFYLELGAYAWGGTLNQPSGTIIERLAKAKADPKLFVNRGIFNQFSAAREAEFEEKLAKLRASSR